MHTMHDEVEECSNCAMRPEVCMMCVTTPSTNCSVFGLHAGVVAA